MIRRIFSAGTAILASVLLLAIALPQLWYPLWFDQGALAACADVLRHGGALYRDCWEVRGPAAVLAYTIPMLVSPSPVAIHAFDLLWQVFTALLLALLAHRMFGLRAAVVAAVLYWLTYASINFFAAAQAESFANLFFVLALYAGWTATEIAARPSQRTAWLTISGFCVGVLFWFNYSFALGGLVPFGIILARVAQRRFSQPASETTTRSAVAPLRVQPVLLYLLGALAALVFGLALFAISGTLPSLQSQITYNIAIFHNVPLSARLDWLRTTFWEEIVAFVSNGNTPTAGFKDTVTQLSLLGRGYPFVFALMLMGLVAGLFRRNARSATWYGLGYFVVAVAICLWQGHFYRYLFLIILPAMALLAAGGLAEWQYAAGHAGLRRISILTTVIAVLFFAGATVGLIAAMLPWVRDAYDNVVVQRKSTAALYQESRLAPYSSLAVELNQRTTPLDRIVIFSDVPAIYVLAQRPNGTRFPYLRWAHAAGSDAIRDEYTQQFLDDLTRSRAKYFVVTRTNYPWQEANFIEVLKSMTAVHDYVERHYHYIGENGPFLIYERNVTQGADQ